MEQQRRAANAAPLGLLGFGMTTVLLNLHNAGITKLSIVIAAMGFALGGAAQIIAGIMEFKNRNTFGATAFTAYGFFWWSLIVIWLNPGQMLAAADLTSMGFYLLLWAVFTAGMFACSLRHNNITKIVFGSLTLLFLLLAAADFSNFAPITTIAGAVGIFCGLSAIYSALGQIIGEEYGKKVFPLL